MKIIIITFLTLLISTSSICFASSEGMPNMPLIQPKKTYSVKSAEHGEQLHEDRGYGDKEAEIGMMNLMMVGGSKFEGMDMAEMSGHSMPMSEMNHGSAHDTKVMAAPRVEITLAKPLDQPKVGANILEFIIKSKAKPVVEVYMTSMDMGTEKPKVKEVAAGRYQVKVIFSMQGPWAVKITANGQEKVFEFKVSK